MTGGSAVFRPESQANPPRRSVPVVGGGGRGRMARPEPVVVLCQFGWVSATVEDVDKVQICWQIDEFGPACVAVLRLPAGCRAVLAIDDVTLGPAVGGVRMNSDVTAEEVTRLARAMTLKNAAAGLPFGGGKAGIRTPSGFAASGREPVIRAFAQAIAGFGNYIPGPDMGTDETAMAWIHDEIGRGLGLPALLGGIPLDQIGATGYGLAVCARALAEAGQLGLEGARVVIQGFGAVGRHAGLFLHGQGARVVAVADRSGAVYDPQGLDIPALASAKQLGRALADTPDVKRITSEELFTLDCELLIPAAQPDVVHDGNAGQIRAKVILPGANIAVTSSAELALHQRGILCVPDFVANAGGVICAWVEYRGGDADRVFAVIDERIRANTLEVLDRMGSADRTPRQAAEAMAWERLSTGRGYRRRFG